MGKLIKMTAIIILVDLLYLTFWGGANSLNSIIVSWILDPANFNSNLVTVALLELGVSIAAGALAAVVVALSGAKTDTVLFAGFAFAVSYNVGKDYLFMYQEITKISPLIATIAIVPFLILYAFVVVEWLKNRD